MKTKESHYETIIFSKDYEDCLRNKLSDKNIIEKETWLQLKNIRNRDAHKNFSMGFYFFVLWLCVLLLSKILPWIVIQIATMLCIFIMIFSIILIVCGKLIIF